MKHNEENTQKLTGLSDRTNMLILIWTNIGVTVYVLANWILGFYLPSNKLNTVAVGIWELTALFVFGFIIASVILLLIKLKKKSWVLLFPYLGTVLLSVGVSFVLPYYL